MRRQYLLVGLFFILVGLIYVSCGPTITVEGPDKPIEIHVTVDINIYKRTVDDRLERRLQMLEEADEEETTSEKGSFLPCFFMKAAYAESDDEKVAAANKRIDKRFAKLIRYKKDLSIGETEKGLVEIRKSSRVKENKDGYKEKLKVFIEKENADREIIIANDVKETGQSEKKVREANLQSWVKNSRKGWWIKVSKDNKWVWAQKK